jgi:hypothetical protein
MTHGAHQVTQFVEVQANIVSVQAAFAIAIAA